MGRSVALVVAMALMAATLLVGGACGSSDSADDTTSSTLPVPSLEGIDWGLTSYAGAEAVMVPVIEGTSVSMRLDEGRVEGTGGCNDYFGTYEVQGEILSITVDGTTQKACEPTVTAQERLYLQAISRTASWTMEGIELRLVDSEGVIVATFTEMRGMPLLGTPWTLEMYLTADKNGFTTVLTDTEVTAAFGPDNQVAGTAGCNDYSGAYKVQEDALSVTQLTNTERFCADPPGIMDQETAYLGDLTAAATFDIRADVLTVYDASEMRLLQFRAAGLPE